MKTRSRKIAAAIGIAAAFMGILVTTATSAQNIMQQLAAVQARERAMQLSAEIAQRVAPATASLAQMAARHVIEQRPVVDEGTNADVTAERNSVLIAGPSEAGRARIDKGGPGHGGS